MQLKGTTSSWKTHLKIFQVLQIKKAFYFIHSVPRIVAKKSPSCFFNIRALIFFPKFLHVKNQVYQWNLQNNIITIFLTIKATILDTHGRSEKVFLRKRKKCNLEFRWEKQLLHNYFRQKRLAFNTNFFVTIMTKLKMKP